MLVGSLGLPPGSYLVHAKVNVANLNFSALGSTFVPCSLGYRVDGALSGLDQTWIVLMQAITGTAAASASVGLQGSVALTEKGTVEVTCASVPRTAGPATNVVARYRSWTRSRSTRFRPADRPHRPGGSDRPRRVGVRSAA